MGGKGGDSAFDSGESVSLGGDIAPFLPKKKKEKKERKKKRKEKKEKKEK